MNEIELTRFARVRITHTPRLEAVESGVATTRSAEANAPPMVEAFLSIEALVPRGARAEYGLLGLHYTPAHTGILHARAHCSEGPSTSWANSLAGALDDVRIGLSSEYVEAVLDGLLSSPTLPAGDISVIEAAHGLIGSSPTFFEQVALCAMAALHSSDSELTNGPLNARLRSILNA